MVVKTHTAALNTAYASGFLFLAAKRCAFDRGRVVQYNLTEKQLNEMRTGAKHAVCIMRKGESILRCALTQARVLIFCSAKLASAAPLEMTASLVMSVPAGIVARKLSSVCWDLRLSR
jgi:hypothetical protein